MVKTHIYSIYYNDTRDGPLVHMYGRDENLKRRHLRVRGIEPFFFVRDDAEIPDDPLIKRVERGWGRTYVGDAPVAKVVAYNPKDVRTLRELFPETWEADVLFANRVRYELGIKTCVEVPDALNARPEDIVPVEGSIPPRVGVFDIETSDKEAFAGPESPTVPVTCIAYWDEPTDRFVVFFNGRLTPDARRKAHDYFDNKKWRVQIEECETEPILFEKFSYFLDNIGVNVLCGWNSSVGNRAFDVPYMQNRAKNCDYKQPNWRAIQHFDLLHAYRGLMKQVKGELDSFSLNYVAQYEKIGEKVKKDKVWRMYEMDPGSLIIYNVMDVWLTKEIMLKRRMMDFFLAQAAFAGASLESCQIGAGTDALIDSYMFHDLAKDRLVRATKVFVKKEDKKKDFQGGEVMPPVTGVFQDVIEVDNSAEYVSVMRTFNISPETRVSPEWAGSKFILPNGSCYRKEPRGRIPLALDKIAAQREEKKRMKKEAEARGDTEAYARFDSEENVIKAFGNGFYGDISSDHARDKNKQIGADITDFARYHLNWNGSKLEELGRKNLIGDTDSRLYQAPHLQKPSPEELVNLGKEDAAYLNSTYLEMVRPFGADSHFLNVKWERVHDGLLQAGAKKLYATLYRDAKGPIERNGVRYSIKVRGFRLRRSDSAQITRDVQLQVLASILLSEDKDKIRTYVQGVAKDLRDGKIPSENCGIPTGIHSDDYKNTPLHVKAALWSNRNLGKAYRSGDKPVFYFGSVKGKEHTQVFALDWGEDLPEGAVIDWDATIERVIFKPLVDILALVGIAPSEILSNKRQRELKF